MVSISDDVMSSPLPNTFTHTTTHNHMGGWGSLAHKLVNNMPYPLAPAHILYNMPFSNKGSKIFF